jgi:hypothetical protein
MFVFIYFIETTVDNTATKVAIVKKEDTYELALSKLTEQLLTAEQKRKKKNGKGIKDSKIH